MVCPFPLQRSSIQGAEQGNPPEARLRSGGDLGIWFCAQMGRCVTLEPTPEKSGGLARPLAKVSDCMSCGDNRLARVVPTSVRGTAHRHHYFGFSTLIS